ncbi:MAG: hypothetical protein PHF37_06585 [Phycisphaerae bacterium]|nr:hypothetical protein [Phycisphaerae bacterium]
MNQKLHKRFFIAICWAARIIATLLAGLISWLIVMHLFSKEGLPNPLAQPTDVQFEFIALTTMLTGLLAGWKWPGVGGLFIIGGMLVFHIVEKRIWLGGGLWCVFDIVGLLYLICWFIKRKKGKADCPG